MCCIQLLLVTSCPAYWLQLRACSQLLTGGAGSNFKSGEGDKNAADFKGTSFGYSGDKVVSQRDIQRLVRPRPKP